MEITLKTVSPAYKNDPSVLRSGTDQREELVGKVFVVNKELN